MKPLKILISLCIILGFATNNAYSQKVTGIQEVYWSFSPNPNEARVQIPCLKESISGTVTEYQSFTNDTYHVRPRGVLHGTSGEDYEISYEYNSYGINYPANSFAGSEGAEVYLFQNSMLLKHNNKVVAVIHLAGSFIRNGNGEIIQDVYVESVTCH